LIGAEEEGAGLEGALRKAHGALEGIEKVGGELSGREGLPFEEVAGEDGAGLGGEVVPFAGGAEGGGGKETEVDLRFP